MQQDVRAPVERRGIALRVAARDVHAVRDAELPGKSMCVGDQPPGDDQACVRQVRERVEGDLEAMQAIQKIDGTLVSLYALEAGNVRVSSSNTGKVTPYSLMKEAVSFFSFCETPTIVRFLLPYAL